MQVKFYGGSFHNQVLKVPGELRDLPNQLRNPLSDAGEVYVRHELHTLGHMEVVYVLKGTTPPVDGVLPDAQLGGLPLTTQMS